jgi:spectrin alpha
MKAIIAADELAKDVAGAEALLERHQEHRVQIIDCLICEVPGLTCFLAFKKGEIDAREDSFRATTEAGQLLVEKDHWAAPEVSEKLITLSSEKQNLLTLWEERRILYEQCMDLQLFYR